MKERTKQRPRQRGRPLAGSVHHRRRCSVCRHPEREAIEEAFLDWANVSRLTEEYHLPGRTAIYRHARALGLDARREGNFRRVLGHIIEKSSTVRPSADAVVRAVELYTRLGWIEPPPSENQIATPSSRT
jgi:hypothetical protein